MAKYRKKPVVIEAEQYQGRNDIAGVCRSMECMAHGESKPHVHTIHNNQAVRIERGDFIIPEPDGVHFCPCKPEIFAAIYEQVTGGCGICGGILVEIRGRFPNESRRKVCPTCATERLEQIYNIVRPDFGMAAKSTE